MGSDYSGHAAYQRTDVCPPLKVHSKESDIASSIFLSQFDHKMRRYLFFINLFIVGRMRLCNKC